MKTRYEITTIEFADCVMVGVKANGETVLTAGVKGQRAFDIEVSPEFQEIGKYKVKIKALDMLIAAYPETK